MELSWEMEIVTPNGQQRPIGLSLLLIAQIAGQTMTYVIVEQQFKFV